MLGWLPFTAAVPNPPLPAGTGVDAKRVELFFLLHKKMAKADILRSSGGGRGEALTHVEEVVSLKLFT